MARRALVIASQTAPLQGPISDATKFAAAIEDWGFTVDLRTDADRASRAGILAGYRQLIDATSDGDAALVYYSGHGALVLPEPAIADALPAGARRSYQTLVPTDFDQSTADDFRGITDMELSVLLAQLTSKTENATVVLDCCHAAAMSRNIVERPKALFRSIFTDIVGHVARVIDQGLPIDLLPAGGNDKAVRLVAAGQSQSAYERVSFAADAEAVGTFTESVIAALAEARGQKVTWDELGRRVRERVNRIHDQQRPDIEGPRRRYLFERSEAPRAGAFSIVRGAAPQQAELRAGRIHGVHAGDVYAILPSGAAGDVTRRIGTATVTGVDSQHSLATVALTAPGLLPEGAQAFPLTSAAPRHPVRVIDPTPTRPDIVGALEATGRFDVLGDDAADPPLATIEIKGGELHLVNPAGEPVVPASAYSDAGLKRTVVNLRMLAAAHSLRELRSEDDDLPQSAAEVTWARTDGGEPVELALTGELLPIGAKFILRVVNKHPLKKKLFVSVFDIGVAQRIQLLTTAWPAGFELPAGETFTLGQTASGRLRGLELGWSSQLPPDFPRTETLVVIVTEQPSDLTSLETPGATSDWTPKGTRSLKTSRLQQLVSSFQYGGTRDAKDVNSGTPESYLVQHISFELSPTPLPTSSKDFIFDDRPPPSAKAYVPRGASAPPARIAIRITDLVVHDVRTWFGGADLRLDTLVVTRQPSDGAEAPYAARTWPLPDVHDGEQPPLENVLAYHGPVHDFVELRVWLSRDRSGSKQLTELLAEQSNSPEFRTAAGALLIAAGAVAAGPIVAAAGAATTVAMIAWRVISAALPKTIGLYQTSLLAGEGAGFGLGRHPTQGRFRAKGFSFGYEVIAVE